MSAEAYAPEHVSLLVLVVMIKMYYQNEDEPHAFFSHVINQGRQLLKLWVQDKVQLTVHVVNICILHILHKTTGKSTVQMILFCYTYQSETEI